MKTGSTRERKMFQIFLGIAIPRVYKRLICLLEGHPLIPVPRGSRHWSFGRYSESPSLLFAMKSGHCSGVCENGGKFANDSFRTSSQILYLIFLEAKIRLVQKFTPHSLDKKSPAHLGPLRRFAIFYDAAHI